MQRPCAKERQRGIRSGHQLMPDVPQAQNGIQLKSRRISAKLCRQTDSRNQTASWDYLPKDFRYG